MKKVISVSLILALLASSATALAADKVAYISATPSTNQGLNLDDYIQYTIDFAPTSDANGIERSFLDAESQNEKNVLSAKEYVKSLDLGEIGYSNIESSCLSNLDGFLSPEYNNGDNILTSYTVLVPKAGSGMSFFGTWNNRDFYNRTYAQSQHLIKVTKWTNTQLIKNWINGMINVGFCWAEQRLSVPVTLVQAGLQITPQSVEFISGDDYSNFYSTNLVHRDILTENSLGHWGTDTSEYVTVYQDDYGSADAFIVRVSPKEISSNGHTAEAEAGTLDNLMADHYKDTNYILSQAYTRYLDPNYKGHPVVDSVLSQIVQTKFGEF